MSNQSTVDTRAMRFSGMAAEFERQMKDPGSFSQLGFEDRLSWWLMRNGTGGSKNIHQAVRAPPPALGAVELGILCGTADRHLDGAQILRFAGCGYIEEGHHIIMKGASGSGERFSPVRWGTRPAASTSPSVTSACQSC